MKFLYLYISLLKVRQLSYQKLGIKESLMPWTY